VFHGFFGGDLDAVRSAATEGARLSREVGDLYSLEMMLMNRGLADLFGRNLAESRPLLQEALRTTHQIDDRVGLLYQIGALGCRAESGKLWGCW
jgi:biotin synthase-like enzyme